MNSKEFQNFQLFTDAKLRSMKKDDLIKYIHCLYNNWSIADEIAYDADEKYKRLAEQVAAEKATQRIGCVY